MLALLPLCRKVMTWMIALAVLAACVPTTSTREPLISPNEAVPVALLVPKTAPNGAILAQSLENSALLAVEDLDSIKISLQVYDTFGTPEGAAEAARLAIQDGAKIILGPLFAENARTVGPVAAASGINVLTFSNNPAIAGGNVFILGNTFRTTAGRLVEYALGQGKNDIFIVHADDPGERVGAEAIEQAARKAGANVVGVQSFALSQQGVVDAIPGIAGSFLAYDADTMFVTSGNSGALPFLAALLPEYGVDRDTAQFIGLQRLDVPSSALSLKGLQGAWFATPAPVLAQQFSRRYAAAYGSRPNPIASLAYDGIAAIGALVAQGRSNALQTGALTQNAGFAGVNGPFRLLRDGTNERGLAVAQVENNQVIVIDPAPTSFGSAGF